jgi:transposase InsO family protein
LGEWLLREVGIAALRVNGSMRDELLNGEIFYTLAEARILIEGLRRHDNTVRPHSSLGYRSSAPETATPPLPLSG